MELFSFRIEAFRNGVRPAGSDPTHPRAPDASVIRFSAFDASNWGQTLRV